MLDPKFLFDDQKMQEFIANGFTFIKADLPPELHEAIYRKTEEVFEKEGNPGNNVLPRIPELQQVFDHPAVQGAFTSILGPGHVMHTHRHCHINKLQSEGGRCHKDSYWGYQKVRYHRNRWAMAFYYPQDVSLENGPTAVVPGTHYYMDRIENLDELTRPVLGEAGTIAVVHFDIWHRAMPNRTDRNRYMMKFQFTRMEEPQQPSWGNREASWSGAEVGDKHRVIWSQMWDWSLARQRNGGTLENGNVAELTRTLQDDGETDRLNAAYALGAIGEPAIPGLIQTLQGENEAAQLNAAYALSAVGEPALPALTAALKHENERVRGHAAFALGDIGPAAADAVPALTKTLNDPSEWVRHHAAEALGTIAQNADAAVPALGQALKDGDGQVRYTAAYALARFGPAAQAAVPALRDALHDDNRYASGHSTLALQRIGTPEATEILLDFLTTSRWCPLTSKESTY